LSSEGKDALLTVKPEESSSPKSDSTTKIVKRDIKKKGHYSFEE
jgi:hypothetical protein